MSCPEIGLHNLSKMSEERKPKVGRKEIFDFSWEERREIVEDYLRSGQSKTSIWRKYTGQSEEHGKILRWMRKLGYEDYPAMKKAEKQPGKKPSEERLARLQLERRIAELEKELSEAKMKAIAYSTMIDLAEETFEIKIRKKFNTKPSKK